MTNFDYEAIARRLVNVEQRLAAFSRTRQLGNSSVTLVDGSEVPLSDGVGAGADAALTIPTIEDALADVDEISDAVIDHNLAVPDWLENSGQDIAWDSSQFAVELAEELGLNVADLSTDVSEAVSVANAAQGTADAAQLSAEAAKAEASIKAAEAQSAAEAFAAAEAEAAKLAAVAAASDDASDKAAAAEAAAKVAAAADATAKADAAEAAAKAVASAAQVTADQARTDAAAAHQAAGEAGSLASQAQSTASGKSRIYRSTSAPSGVGTASGDKWERYDKLSAGGKLEATWAWSGNAWISTEMSEAYLPLVNIGAGTYGTLTGNRLAANAIDGMTITGALVRTASKGQRMELDLDGLRAINASGQVTAVMSPTGTGLTVGIPGGSRFQVIKYDPNDSTFAGVTRPGKHDGGTNMARLTVDDVYADRAYDSAALELSAGKSFASFRAGGRVATQDHGAAISVTGALQINTTKELELNADAIRHRGDTNWANIPLTNSFEAHSNQTPQWRVWQGKLYLRGAVKPKSGSFDTSYSTFTPSAAIPALGGDVRDGFRSVRVVPTAGGRPPGRMYMNGAGALLVATTGGTATYYLLNSEYLIGDT